MKSFFRRRDEKGAALIEFAIAAPLLVLLLLGIIEFGWLFGQFNAVRHGAREAGRYAVVNGGLAGGATATQVADRACQAIRADSAGMTSLVIDLNNGGGAIGANATVTVRANVSSITGLFGGLVPQLSSTATFRMEKQASWNTQTVNIANPSTCT